MFTNNDLRKLIIPLILEQLLGVTVGMIDGIMVARVGEAAVSGISLVDSINILLIGLFTALATGGAVISAQHIGQKDYGKARNNGEQLILINFIISTFIMLVTLFARNMILNFIFKGIEVDVMGYANTYFFYSALSFPVLGIYSGCTALFRAMGNSKTPLYVSIVMNVINIVGNYILIFKFNLDVAGAAIATLIARIIASGLMYYLLRNSRDIIKIRSFMKYRPNMSLIKRILKIGIPNGIENSVFQVGKILVQGVVASFGTSVITANAVANSISAFAVLPGASMGLALITVIGQLMGSKDFDGIKEYTRRLLKTTFITMAITNAIILMLVFYIPKMYNLSAETSAITIQLIVVYCIVSTFLWPPAFALPNAIRATNDVKFTMIVSILSMWTFRIVLSYILGITFKMGIMGVWIAMMTDWLCRGICFVLRFRQEKFREVSMHNI